MSSNKFKDNLYNLTNNVKNIASSKNIDLSLSSFITNIESICKPLFERDSVKNNCKQDQSKGHNLTFDRECLDKRKVFYSCLNISRKNKTMENKLNMIKARSEYKKEVRTYNYRQGTERTNILLNAKYKNVKHYWNLLKETSSQTKPKNISTDKFAEYFKAINNPEDPFFQPDEDIIYFNERFFNSEIQIMFNELNVPIAESEIRSNVKQLGQGRAGGPDRLLNEFFYSWYRQFCWLLRTVVQ